MNKDKKPFKKQGFTIIEVLMALFVFSVCIISVFPVLFAEMSALKHLKNRLVASGYMDNETLTIEKILYNKRKGFTRTRILTMLAPVITINSDVSADVFRDGLYHIKIEAFWEEGRKAKKMIRSADIFMVTNKKDNEQKR